jgi:hypothetical protein
VKATDRYSFPFPEPEDFGDGSTQIAALADKINDELQGRIDAYNTLLKPETYIRARSSSINFANSASYGSIFWDQDVYSSNPIFNSVATNFLKVSTPGIYHAGMFAWVSAIGATNLNTSRQFMLEFTDRRGPSLADAVDLQWEQTTLEAATGCAVTLYAIFPVYTPDYSGAGLTGYFRHSNTSSQMAVLSPSCMWISRLGDLAV